MAASADDISRWFDEGKARSTVTHMVVVCDTFDYEDYPVYVVAGENVHKVVDENNNAQNMSRVMEVYKMSDDKEEQLRSTRNFRY